MFALASQTTIAPIAAPLRARKAPKTALRRAAVRVNASSDAKSDNDRAEKQTTGNRWSLVTADATKLP